MAYKVLIVDDDINIAELLNIYLTKENFDTVCAYDGKQAIETFASENPDVILLDIMLPEINGYELSEYIKPMENL